MTSLAYITNSRTGKSYLYRESVSSKKKKRIKKAEHSSMDLKTQIEYKYKKLVLKSIQNSKKPHTVKTISKEKH